MYKLTCFCRTSRSVTALARSSTRFPSIPAVWRTRPQSFCWQAFSYRPLRRSRTVTTRPSSNIPSVGRSVELVRVESMITVGRSSVLSHDSPFKTEATAMASSASSCSTSFINNYTRTYV